jgi:anaerobic magnesium-protoporphyrin IX monomethyl ester cyclase
MQKLTFVKVQHPWQYDPFSDPPLGLLSVAATARELGGLDVSLSDMACNNDMDDAERWKHFADRVPEADIFGFSCSTLEFPGAVSTASHLKEIFPSSKIMVGGPHFDVFPEKYWLEKMPELPFDIVCRGEGEANIGEAIKILNEGESRNRPVVSSEGPLLDLTKLPLPARDLLDREKYFKPGKTFSGSGAEEEGNSSTAMVSRGCPWGCGFCASPTLHRGKVRFRSLENVEEELRVLQEKYGVSTLRWQDDCMPLTLRRIEGLPKLLHKSGIFSRGSARTDEINPQVLEDLWYAGFRELGFGIESAEQNVLDYLHKRTTVETNHDALLATKGRGFKTRAFIMTGLPGETKDSAKSMIDFLESTDPDVVTLTSFVPLPGCDIYHHPQNYGVQIMGEDWGEYNIAISRNSGTPWTHRIETATLQEMENNRERLKEYLFNKGKSNVEVYNEPYQADIPRSD